jgi:tyrosine-protein phosphatase YwqE
MLKNLFSRSHSAPSLADFSRVGADMHSHLIPGIDDGARTMEDSLNLVREMHRLGFSKLITTPHIQSEFYRNTPEIILSGLGKLREAISAEGIPVTVEAAAEYLLDDGFEGKLKAGDLLSFSDKYILIEMSYYSPHPNLKSFIFDLQVEGYKVILAHPERYTYWFSDFLKYEDLKDRGVYFQLNTVSLAGYYPEPVRKFAEKLIEKNMIDFIGSDMHNMRYMEALQKSLKEKALGRLLASGRLLNPTL